MFSDFRLALQNVKKCVLSHCFLLLQCVQYQLSSLKLLSCWFAYSVHSYITNTDMKLEQTPPNCFMSLNDIPKSEFYQEVEKWLLYIFKWQSDVLVIPDAKVGNSLCWNWFHPWSWSFTWITLLILKYQRVKKKKKKKSMCKLCYFHTLLRKYCDGNIEWATHFFIGWSKVSGQSKGTLFAMLKKFSKGR